MKKIMMILAVLFAIIGAGFSEEVRLVGKVRGCFFEGDKMFVQVWDGANSSSVQWAFIETSKNEFSYLYGMFGQALKNNTLVYVTVENTITAKWPEAATNGSCIKRVSFWSQNL